MERSRIEQIRSEAQFCLEIDEFKAMELINELIIAQDIMESVVEQHKSIREDTVQIPMDVYMSIAYFVHPELKALHEATDKQLAEQVGSRSVEDAHK